MNNSIYFRLYAVCEEDWYGSIVKHFRSVRFNKSVSVQDCFAGVSKQLGGS